jgi:hypothetical protein
MLNFCCQVIPKFWSIKWKSKKNKSKYVCPLFTNEQSRLWGTFDTMLVMSILYIQRRLCSFVNRGHTYLDLFFLLFHLMDQNFGITWQQKFNMRIQSVHHHHSIECTLFFPWYSWWLYKVYIIIIVSNVPCSFPDTADDCTKCTSQS